MATRRPRLDGVPQVSVTRTGVPRIVPGRRHLDTASSVVWVSSRHDVIKPHLLAEQEHSALRPRTTDGPLRASRSMERLVFRRTRQRARRPPGGHQTPHFEKDRPRSVGRSGLLSSMPSLGSEIVDRSASASDRLHQRTAGWFALGAGAMFMATVGYLFLIMTATGWTIDMFDAPADLLIWVNAHERVYQGLWVLYFLSQMLLLPVPSLLSGGQARATAVFGTAAVVLAMVGLVVIFAVSPVLAHAYSEASTDPMSSVRERAGSSRRDG